MTPTMLLVVFCGVLFWARAPFCCCCGHFCVRRYANLAGGFAFRPSAGCWFLCFCFDVATVVFELYSCGLVKLVQTFADLIRLSCFKDRVSELYRPHSESKKEAGITASLVRILQFLYDSACGNAGTLMVSASLTLYACQLMGPWEYRKVPSFYGQTYGHCHCHQTHHCHHLHHHLRPQAHLPVVGCSLMGVSYHLCPFVLYLAYHCPSVHCHRLDRHLVGHPLLLLLPPSPMLQGWLAGELGSIVL